MMFFSTFCCTLCEQLCLPRNANKSSEMNNSSDLEPGKHSHLRINISGVWFLTEGQLNISSQMNIRLS